ISSALLTALSQRLIRIICPSCRKKYYPSGAVLRELGVEEEKRLHLFSGNGCSECYDSGFKGRTGLHEILEMDEGLQALIIRNPTNDDLQKYLKERGHKSLRDVGYQKVLEGKTTIEEIRRVISMEL
ncbi:MAG: hypothetical protein WCY54_11135, partial [Syntrophales bacterium]